MAILSLSDNFRSFFSRINPSSSFEATASSQYNTIKVLLENRQGLAGGLAIKCFLQGSYRNVTAIHTINDIDIVALCDLLYPPPHGTTAEAMWDRNRIFETVAAPLLSDRRYRDRVNFTPTSMCIKLDLGIKVEILPVMYAAETYPDSGVEPFILYRPENLRWEKGYARYHQAYLSQKNENTSGNFIPAIKVFKHINKIHQTNAISFHLECLLYNLHNSLFEGNPADYIANLLMNLANLDPFAAHTSTPVKTPCGERDIFTESEWSLISWVAFHMKVVQLARVAAYAINTSNRNDAIEAWKIILGNDYFPYAVSI